MMTGDDRPLFHEEQRFGSVWWVMLLILAIAALIWWGFLQQILFGEPWGTNPAPDWMMWLLWLLVGIGLPLLFWRMGLIVEVNKECLSIRYVPLLIRCIPWLDINAVDVLTYKPIRQFGGWGIRGLGDVRAYTISGDRGVQITLHDGRKILIGSRHPEALALAIESRLHH